MHCDAQQEYENWQANPHLLTANIAHLYHYHGEEEEEIWSVDKQNDGYFENKDIDMMMMTNRMKKQQGGLMQLVTIRL